MDNKKINALQDSQTCQIQNIGQAYQKLFELNKEAVLLFGENGILESNPAANELFGASTPQALSGLKLSELSPIYQDNRDSSDIYFQSLFQSAIQQGSINATCRLKAVNSGRDFSASVYVNVLELDKQPVFLLTVQNLKTATSSGELQLVSADGRDIEWHATHDALTMLPNRTLLKDRFAQAIYTAKRHETLLAVCMLDLDEFKPVNDTYGHEVGDQLLVQVASRIKQGIRQDDTVARLGGDEFVILLGGINEKAELSRTLQRLKSALAQPYYLDDMTITLSCSIGASIFPKDPSDVDTLLRHADQAMYIAKQSGKNRVHWFDMAHDQKVASSQQMIVAVEKALLDKEFELFYQPKVDMREGSVIGMEALLRWNHPDRGLVPPLDFLPLIEQHDLIIHIGQWVIEQALAQQVLWKKQGRDWTVSVNIASRHLQIPEFYQQLKTSLAMQPEVVTEKLEIEILESVGLEDVQRIQQLIVDCQALGVGFALDDFGTGYSSLSYLKRLPADTLKIDQTFIRDILDDKDDLALVQAIVGLAKTFNRKVIAEGVETVEQGVLLMRLGCDQAQGYGIARPMPANEVIKWADGFTLGPRWRAWSEWEWDLRAFPLLVAQLDIREWATRTIDGVEDGTLSVDEAHLASEKNCRFGHWYNNDGDKRYGEFSAFKAIDSVHIRWHQIANNVVELYKEGRISEAQERCVEFRQVQTDLLTMLDQLELLVTTNK